MDRLTIEGPAVDESATSMTRVWSLSGELDAHTADDLAAALPNEDNQTCDIVLDVAGLTFVDSTGLRVVVAHHRACTQHGHKLTLRGPSPSVRKTLEYAGLADHLLVEIP